MSSVSDSQQPRGEGRVAGKVERVAGKVGDAHLPHQMNPPRRKDPGRTNHLPFNVPAALVIVALLQGSGTLCEALLMVEAYRGNIVCPNKHVSAVCLFPCFRLFSPRPLSDNFLFLLFLSFGFWFFVIFVSKVISVSKE